MLSNFFTLPRIAGILPAMSFPRRRESSFLVARASCPPLLFRSPPAKGQWPKAEGIAPSPFFCHARLDRASKNLSRENLPEISVISV